MGGASQTNLEALEEGHLLAESAEAGRFLEHLAGDAGGEVATVVHGLAHVVDQGLGRRQSHHPLLDAGVVHLVGGVQHLHLTQHAGDVADLGLDLHLHLLDLLGGHPVVAALVAAVGAVVVRNLPASGTCSEETLSREI